MRCLVVLASTQLAPSLHNNPPKWPNLTCLLTHNEVCYVLKDIPTVICGLPFQTHFAVINDKESLWMRPVRGHERILDIIYHHMDLIGILIDEAACDSDTIFNCLVLVDLDNSAKRPLVLSMSLSQIDGKEDSLPFQLSLK